MNTIKDLFASARDNNIHIAGVDTDIENAMMILIDAMRGKTHRDGMPAFLHSVRVGMAQDTKRGIILGLLHDVVEDDGDRWYKKIHQILDRDITILVEYLTRDHHESYHEYIVRLCESNDITAIKVKMSDIEDNMNPLRSDEKARKKAVTYGRAYDMLRIAHDRIRANQQATEREDFIQREGSFSSKPIS